MDCDTHWNEDHRVDGDNNDQIGPAFAPRIIARYDEFVVTLIHDREV